MNEFLIYIALGIVVAFFYAFIDEHAYEPTAFMTVLFWPIVLFGLFSVLIFRLARGLREKI